MLENSGEKLKVAVVFGGMSTENEVSCVSAKSVISNLDKDKYDIYPIFISKNGDWFLVSDFEKKFKSGVELENKESILNIVEFLKKFDVVFPVLHGLYGEDGTIQGLLELIKVPYVGCKVLASSVGMDKVYTKVIFDKAGLLQAKYVYLKIVGNKYILVNDDFTFEEMPEEYVLKNIENRVDYPMFVKPSNSGSSVGVMKVTNVEQLRNAILEAAKYDEKILVEQGICGKEVECAVLGNDNVIASCVGEIKSADEFYDYDSKYNNQNSKTIIPANISEDDEEKIRSMAIKAFRAIDGKGLSRIDFFIEEKTNEIYINEINTLPGFTNISMYPKLFEHSGIKYSDLLDKLICLALGF